MTKKHQMFKLSVLLVGSLMLLAVFGQVITAQAMSTTTKNGLMQNFVRLSQDTGSTDNWAGYLVMGGAQQVTAAIASWKVPAVSGNGYSSFWVGIDDDRNDLEQIGTMSQMVNGVATYFAWYEYLPSNWVTITSTTIHPGDTIIGTVYEIGQSGTSYNIQVNIYDVTQGDTQFHTTQWIANWHGNSAEYIAEAPIVGTLQPLANFGTAYFGQDYTSCIPSCEATINGQSGYIGSFGVNNWVQITMMSANNQYVKAATSALSSDGSSFTVTWENAGP